MKNFNFSFQFIVAPFCIGIFCSREKPARFHVALDYRYNLGLRERSDLWTLKRDTNKMGGNSIHLTFLYHVTSRITAGAGFGLDGYTSPSHNSHFVFGTVRYRPLKKCLNSYLYTNLGYSFTIMQSSLTSGWHWDAGIGYTKMFARHFGLNCQFGYNLRQFEYTVKGRPFISYDVNSLRHSLSFGVGVIF